ncbi:MAG: Cell division FtsK/SpoIIIE [Candidatus Nomurabacteria bacterium GW2011_GWF2_35_66]|uniref:Cell division FtsK/SpoIIIE n=1 Tax=Candidatus Nomurabacteria bacterium GW2011_GWE1_35_16 TaxID=1618761 RepID=A0A0G0BS45_9BACT|nr:MAG: Cell division FtsK/SpoIIIE [Candidatus Nomurabacteria bacterium GW2011_GWF1_34_20]KKP63254.1 MAG: Cell division FtsK/SpoIIIE [Candidatus Nomurabacteria bacterium GW2011_GWE2_34_25]KKP66456.1 MAG: Cell division FtsK/SpoIIIE [Candidatus Nomurabacteria bacterium GW2011_GWE1_35_16]KKP83350.1 MAG: Cell division FtsK/SpoIIIE [Candidatus Nomurabacteria bacterium GW2011_GWF2_35_66]HAE36467.1 cell division protein FtsK [Candidatus Nomurabacteria bacterium]
MAKKDKEYQEKEEAKRNRKSGKNNRKKVELKEETTDSIWGIIFLVLGLLILLSIFRLAGVAGDFIYKMLSLIFGFGYYLLPIILGIVGVSFLKEGMFGIARLHLIMGASVLLSTLGIMDLATNGVGTSTVLTYGGQLGRLVAFIMSPFGVYGGILLLGTILIISLIVLGNERPNLLAIWHKIKNIFNKEIPLPFTETESIAEIALPNIQKENEKPIEQELEYSEVAIKTIEEEKLSPKKKFHTDYIAPPLSLLEKDKGKPNIGDMKGNTNIIQRTLLNFGIPVEMDEVTVGPTVTRYALKPAQGVKLSRIVGLQNDLALALAAHPIRIEAPIPGKSLVGVEIPNKVKSTVGLATLLSDDKFQNSPKPLTVALGRGLSGKAVFGNLAKMPHALIAGTTGSGKSVTIHSIITSLLYRNGPEDMKLIMVDPKRVELTLYNKIPHLLTPVITDPKKTILALKWAAKEMDRRYDVLQAESVRDIESYHSTVYAKSKEGEAERMPYIVIVIDELADIMQAYPRELESAIVRLAQMSRAVGIHIILSTQRPSVNVITGLIKANIPTRIALQVSSQIDSRTILDQGGAEKLLGAGDMLYASGEMSQPERLQSAFISEDEVKRVVEYLKNAYMDEIPDQIVLTGNIEKGSNLFSDSMESESGEDDLYEEAREVVIRDQKASTSYLQRKLGVGYARAAKLIDMLEDHGVVGPGNGAKPRDVLEKGVNNTDDIAVGQ